jgi:hypothetical protein
MENWSYRAREFWLRHSREIKRYGFCLALVLSGVIQRSFAPAWLGLGGAAVMWAYDNWGRPWAERGRLVMNRKKSNSPQA